jgi:hypothetical protein
MESLQRRSVAVKQLKECFFVREKAGKISAGYSVKKIK